MMEVLRSEMKQKLESLHEENKIEWATAPTNVNAYHTFQSNTISE